jgi:PAS domain S-box-containing protein
VFFERLRSQIVGSNIERLLAATTLAEYRSLLPETAAVGERVIFEGEILAQDGHTIHVSISAAPILLHGRRLVLGLYRDVTDRRAAEAEIQRLRAQLAQRGGV